MLTNRDGLKYGATALAAVFVYGVWREMRPDPLAGRAEIEEGSSVRVPEGFTIARTGGKLLLHEGGDGPSPRRMKVSVERLGFFAGEGVPRRGLVRETRHGRLQVNIDALAHGSDSGSRRLLDILPLAKGEAHFEAVVFTDDLSGFDFVWPVVESLRRTF